MPTFCARARGANSAANAKRIAINVGLFMMFIIYGPDSVCPRANTFMSVDSVRILFIG